jgi:hypothetical protein
VPVATGERLLTWADRPLDATCRASPGFLGLDPLTDRQLAGLIMSEGSA